MGVATLIVISCWDFIHSESITLFFRPGDRGNTDNKAEDNVENDDDDEAVDMEDFEESGMLHMIDPVCISLKWIHSIHLKIL